VEECRLVSKRRRFKWNKKVDLPKREAKNVRRRKEADYPDKRRPTGSDGGKDKKEIWE
jgi:hypothetical protein